MSETLKECNSIDKVVTPTDIILPSRHTVTVIKLLLEEIDLLSISSNHDKAQNLKIESVCHSLFQLDHPSLQCDLQMLKVTLGDFYSSLDNLKNQEHFHNEDMLEILKSIVYSVYKILLKQDSIEVKHIISEIDICQEHFTRSVSINCYDDILHSLKLFVDTISSCLSQIKNRFTEIISLKQRQVVMLCITQIYKCISIIVSFLQHQNSNKIDTTKSLGSYLSKRVTWCFTELKSSLVNNRSFSNEEKIYGGQFVHKMDTVLEMLSSFNEESSQINLKSAVDEVLCHAMSIAHVAVVSDSDIITLSCQKVLRALEEVKKKYCSEENPCAKGLYIGSLAEALEILEQQVNTALLKLVLEVFYDYSFPLKKLLDACENACTVRHSKDLERDISDFDLHMDRIMQIGLFATTCSEDATRVIGIRSCLASLESLEPELIPALLAHYLEPQNTMHKYFLRELVIHWRSEVSELKKLLHNIIDSAAFSEVVYKDVHTLVSRLKSKLAEDTKLLAIKISIILKKSTTLAQQLKISLSTEDGSKIPISLNDAATDFYFACNELDMAFKSILNEKQDASSSGKIKLLKRCELIVSSMKKLHPLLLEVNNTDKEKTCLTHRSQFTDRRGTNLSTTAMEFPKSVQDLPIDENSRVSDGKICVTMEFAKLMEMGKVLSKERSVLYFTPKKIQNLTTAHKHSEIPLDHTDLLSKTDSCCLDITNILDQLTSLSDTLTSKKDLSSTVVSEVFDNMSPSSNSHDLQVPSLEDISTPNQPHCATSRDSTGHEVNTPQRLDDLRTVLERIAALKAGK